METRRRIDKNGLDFSSVDEEFFENAVVVGERAGRYMAIGSIDGLPVSVIFKPLGSEAFALISLRPANRKERQHR